MYPSAYFIDIDGGITDSSLVFIRHRAMEYMMSHDDKQSIPIYSSPTCKRFIGKVIYTATYPVFVWIPDRGQPKALRIDGTTTKAQTKLRGI